MFQSFQNHNSLESTGVVQDPFWRSGTLRWCTGDREACCSAEGLLDLQGQGFKSERERQRTISALRPGCWADREMWPNKLASGSAGFGSSLCRQPCCLSLPEQMSPGQKLNWKLHLSILKQKMSVSSILVEFPTGRLLHWLAENQLTLLLKNSNTTI